MNRPYKPPDINTIPRRITRDLVLEHLRDPGKTKPKFTIRKRVQSPQEEIERYLKEAKEDVPEGSLEDVRNWLNGLADEEQKRIDWTPEYSRTSAAQAEEGSQSSETPRGLSRAEGHTISSVDAEILKRISLGYGPRSSNLEDLVAPFRKISAEPHGETYEELSGVLQDWNIDVIQERYGQIAGPEQRDDLLRALDERLHVAACVLRGQCPQTDLDQNDVRLLKALHAFRPETAQFVDQTPYVILVALVANTWVAEPDIRFDMELWIKVFKAMMAEVHFQFYKEENRIKGQIKAKLDSARRMANKEEVERLTNEKYKINREYFRRGGLTVLNDLKEARRSLYQKIVQELMELTIVQAGQKSFYEGLAPPIIELLSETCDKADTELKQVLRNQMDVLELARSNQDINIEILKGLNSDSLRRTRKFSAEDITDPVERALVLRERKENVGTADMMLKVKQETEHVRESSRLVLQRMSGLETALEQVYEAAKGRLQAYEEVHDRVSQDDVAKLDDRLARVLDSDSDGSLDVEQEDDEV